MKIIKKVISILLILCILCGCGSSKKYVSYTVYPIGYLINRIAGNRVESISVQDNAIVENSKAIDNFDEVIDDSAYLFYISGLEPYLDVYKKKIDASKVKKQDLSVLNTIYKFQRYTYVSAGGVETYIEAPYYSGECFNEIDMYDQDLFLWMNPICMLSMANDVYTVLSSNYVEQSAFFEENYETLKNDLVNLDAQYNNLSTKIKKENKTIKFVSISPSFGSWQKAYGFQVYPVCLSKYGLMPTDEQLEIIKARIIEDNVKYIAYEPNMSEDMLNLFNELKDELGLQRVDLNNISSLTYEQTNSGKDYLSIMKDNLLTLEKMAQSSSEIEGEVNEE